MDTMNVLIVDDDLSTVACIRSSMDWESFGIGQVFTAYSKKGALEVLKRQKIDIVICDIEMPMGSGLELLAEIRDMSYDCDFIFLTCHDSFDFASAALSYQAASYILKPFQPEVLEAELLKTIKNQKVRRSIYESSRYGEYWLKNKLDIERNFWKDLLLRKFPSDRKTIQTEAANRGIRVNTEETLLLVLLSIQYDTLPKAKMAAREQWARDAVTFLTENRQCRFEASHVVSWWRGERLHIYCIQPDPEALFLDQLKQLLKRCKESFSAAVNGYALRDVPIEQLSQATGLMEKADRNNVGNLNQLQFLQDGQNSRQARKQIDLSQFRTLVASGNKLRLLTYLRSQLEALAPERSLTPAILYAAQQEIIQEGYAYLINRGIRLELPAEDQEAYTVMSNASTSMYNMVKWLSFFVNSVIDADSALNQKNTVVEQAKVYIDAHYSEKLTQEEIAKAVYLTPGHLSKVFRRETGISLNQYINDKRLQQAKALLANSAMDISEVAIRSGFSSSSYFITYFRKATGETPGEYRENRSGAPLPER